MFFNYFNTIPLIKQIKLKQEKVTTTNKQKTP